MNFTYQTLIPDSASVDAALSRYAQLFGSVERTLFAAIADKKDPDDLKSTYLNTYGITARQFNAIAIGLKGKIKAAQESRTFEMGQLRGRIKKAEEVVEELSDPPSLRYGRKETPANRRRREQELHQKKRRLHRLEQRLEVLKKEG